MRLYTIKALTDPRITHLQNLYLLFYEQTTPRLSYGKISHHLSTSSPLQSNSHPLNTASLKMVDPSEINQRTIFSVNYISSQPATAPTLHPRILSYGLPTIAHPPLEIRHPNIYNKPNGTPKK